MVDWSLVLLIVFAIALPGLLLLRFIPYVQVLEARFQGVPSPRWHVYLASIFPLLFFLLFFMGGTAGLVVAITSRFKWSMIAIALLSYGLSGRSGLNLAVLYSKRDPAATFRMSQQVQAVGEVAAGIAFLIASFTEVGWMALSAVLFMWFGGVHLYTLKKATRNVSAEIV